MSRRLWPWSDLKQIFPKASRTFGGKATVSLTFHRRSGVPLDYVIQGFEFLTLEEADEILESLDAYLAKRHPDIDVELFDDEEE